MNFKESITKYGICLKLAIFSVLSKNYRAKLEVFYKSIFVYITSKSGIEARAREAINIKVKIPLSLVKIFEEFLVNLSLLVKKKL